MSIATTHFEQERKQLQAKVFSSVAHDLRTPLACIIGSLQTLDQMKEKLSSEQHDTLVATALDQANRLDILFTAMLDKARPE